MSSFNPHHVVNLLLKDPCLIENWLVLAKVLNSNNESVAAWKTRRDSGADYRQVFIGMITEWQSRWGLRATNARLATILRETNFQMVAELVEQYNEREGQSEVQPRHIGIQPSIYNFVGRIAELAQLNDFLTNKEKTSLLVCGLAGMGKTELVKHFVAGIRDNTDTTVLWLHGQSRETLSSSIYEVAVGLSVSVPENKKSQPLDSKILQMVLDTKAVRSSTNLLIVVDNVDDNHTLYQDIYHSIRINNAQLVVTSTNRDIFEGESEILDIKEIEWDDAIELVSKGLRPSEFPESDIQSICTKFQNYPLGLQQAIAYIKQQQRVSLLGRGYTIKDFLKDLELQPDKILDKPLKQSPYSNSTMRTIIMAIDSMQRGVEGTNYANILLNVISFLNPDVIAVPLFCKQLKNVSGKADDCTDSSILDGIQLLKLFCLINCENQVISVHRIVQDVVRLKMKHYSTYSDTINSIVSNIDLKDWARTDFGHILTLWKHITTSDEMIVLHCDFAQSIVTRLFQLSLINEVYEFSISSLDLFKRLLGESNRKTFTMERALANAVNWKGENSKALTMLQDLHTRQQCILGDEDEDTLLTSHDIAIQLRLSGEMSEAIIRHKRILEMKQKIYPNDLNSIFISKHNIALNYKFLKDYENAMVMYNEVYRWRMTNLGPTHRETIRTLHDIGLCCYYQGKYQEARVHLQKALDERLEQDGELNIETLRTKRVLGHTFQKLGDVMTARSLYKDAYDGHKAMFGEDNELTKQSLSDLMECPN